VRPNNRRKKGFTLVEVIVATALLGIGITMGFSALSGMTRTEIRLRELEKMNLLAVQKLNEVIAVGGVDSQETEGSFEEYGEPNYKWTLESAASGTENLDTVRIIVEAADSKSTDPSASASGLVFTSPNIQAGVQ
jgi:prepilin-type N-terminal cleavage/methylation domain-containing protein